MTTWFLYKVLLLNVELYINIYMIPYENRFVVNGSRVWSQPSSYIFLEFDMRLIEVLKIVSERVWGE